MFNGIYYSLITKWKNIHYKRWMKKKTVMDEKKTVMDDLKFFFDNYGDSKSFLDLKLILQDLAVNN